MKAPIICIGSIIFATALNPRLSIIIYSVVALIAGFAVISIKMSFIRFAKLQVALDKINSVMQEYLLGVRLVKAFGTYTEEEERFDSANENLKKHSISTQMIIAVISPIMGLIVGLGVTLAIYFGSMLFNIDLIEPGDIAAFVAYMSQMLMSLMMITSIFNVFVRAKASAARINEVLDSEEDFNDGEISLNEAGGLDGEISLNEGDGFGSDPMNDTDDLNGDSSNETDGFDSNSSVNVKHLDGSLDFQNVTFTYPQGSTPAIVDLSFSVSPGETLAVIGPTGSGKSTLCWLIMRFYDTDSGNILLGGHDIRTLSVNTVRSNTSIAPQKPLLFSGTVNENIRWGNENASDEEVQNVAGQVQAAAFIEDMQQGYESLLGRGGVNISGGQKQRISIARALIKNAPIVMIDDATSALDSITEAKVRTELAAYPGTKLIITQRCVAAMHADKILVLENGHCVGFGAHADLINTCDVYMEIWQSQIDSKGVVDR